MISDLTGKMILSFPKTLVEAENAGVEILVYKCNNTLEGIELVPKSLDYDLNALKNK